jgi:hypothetical protein
LEGESGGDKAAPSSSDYTPQEITNTAQSSGLTTAAVIAALNAGATPKQIIDKASNEKVTDTEEVDPSDGTGTPVKPKTNLRIEELMANGATYEQAVANQNAAIKAGADANSDGMVTNAEWSAHVGGDSTESSESTESTESTETTETDKTTSTETTTNTPHVTGSSGTLGTLPTKAVGGGSGSADGNNSGGSTSSTNSGSTTTSTGPGVTGTDNGPGNGPEEGPGGNGPGGNGPGGNGMMGMAGSGGGVPFEKFSQLDPYVWQRFQKRRNPLINTAPTPTQNRRNLLSGLWNEAMK